MQTLLFLFAQEGAERPITLWGVVIPAAILLLSLWVAVALYRHFSRRSS
jgi:hypothetical protein